MARPRGVEPLTPRSVVWCSIQLSYGRINGLSSTQFLPRHSLGTFRSCATLRHGRACLPPSPSYCNGCEPPTHRYLRAFPRGPIGPAGSGGGAGFGGTGGSIFARMLL